MCASAQRFAGKLSRRSVRCAMRTARQVPMRRNWQRLRASERNDCVVTDVTNNSRNTVDFVNSHNSFDGVDGNNDFDSNNSVDSHNFANTVYVVLGNVDDHLDALDDDDDVVWRFINNNIVD